jgi:mycothiol synthase
MPRRYPVAVTGIAYPTAPSLPGVTFRHIVMPDDLAVMNDVANAMRLAEGDEWITSDDQFRSYYETLSNCDPATDIVIAERDDRVVGYGRVEWAQELDGARTYEILAFAHPAEEPPLLRALFHAAEARGLQIAATHPAGPKFLQTDANEAADRRLAILEELGYEPVRFSFLMTRPNLDDVPDAPMPPGLEVRPVQPDQLRAIFDAEVEAFRDHWGATLPGEADFQRFVNDPVEGNYALWQVGWDGDQVAGMVRGYINAEENERLGHKRGWVENISVRRPWRRRGLARALIASSIRALREQGMTEGALGVDTENPTGALRVYESCGFVVHKREATYRRPID